MKIELKKLKIAENMSEETTAFTADIYVNGKSAGYAKNDGQGGCTFYHSNPDPQSRKLIEDAEKHCLGLPPINYGTFEHKMDLEGFIDQLVEDELKAKEAKKIAKKFANHIILGVPNGNTYRQIKFNYPLNAIPKDKLQPLVDKYKLELKDGEKILNTNLEALGIIV